MWTWLIGDEAGLEKHLKGSALAVRLDVFNDIGDIPNLDLDPRLFAGLPPCGLRQGLPRLAASQRRIPPTPLAHQWHGVVVNADHTRGDKQVHDRRHR